MIEMHDKSQITVARLIELLQNAVAINQDVASYVVDSEGCDCIGESFGIAINQEDKSVLVTRFRYAPEPLVPFRPPLHHDGT